jgi:hypothetical protein
LAIIIAIALEGFKRAGFVERGYMGERYFDEKDDDGTQPAACLSAKACVRFGMHLC